MAHFLGILWGSILAVYWLITGALLADLYDRYCDDIQASNDQCNDIDKKFILMPTTAFFCMTAWVSSYMSVCVCHTHVLCCIDSSDSHLCHTMDVWQMTEILTPAPKFPQEVFKEMKHYKVHSS